MKSVEIRPELTADIPSVYRVNRRAFDGKAEAELVDALRRNCKDLISLVAVDHDHVVGHILFSPAVIRHDGGQIDGMGLAPMAVVPERHRQGIGSRLLEAGMKQIEARQCPFVIVLGHPEYYPRFGFEPASKWHIGSTWDAPDEAFLIRVLKPGVLAGVTGTAHYRPEFDVFQ